MYERGQPVAWCSTPKTQKTQFYHGIPILFLLLYVYEIRMKKWKK